MGKRRVNLAPALIWNIMKTARNARLLKVVPLEGEKKRTLVSLLTGTLAGETTLHCCCIAAAGLPGRLTPSHPHDKTPCAVRNGTWPHRSRSGGWIVHLSLIISEQPRISGDFSKSLGLLSDSLWNCWSRFKSYPALVKAEANKRRWSQLRS